MASVFRFPRPKGTRTRIPGASSPIVFSWLFAGPAWSIAYMVAFGLSVWSSLVLKRHKKTDILAGVACMLTGFLISLALALDSGWRP